MDKNYLYLLSIILVILSALIIGYMSIDGQNIVETINKNTFNNIIFTKIIYASIGIAGLYLALNKNTYSLFIDNSLFPAPALINHYKYDDLAITVDGEGGKNIVYWAADPENDQMYNECKDKICTAKEAHNKNDNTGVVPVSVDGTATLFLKCPKTYKTGIFDKTMPKHINYRIIKNNNILSEVKTKEINCLV
jgi:uncharacterized membrane protein YuzA (DUF378 family)